MRQWQSPAQGILSLDFCLRDRDHARAGKLGKFVLIISIPGDPWFPSQQRHSRSDGGIGFTAATSNHICRPRSRHLLRCRATT
jgi:hypothetical protein